jgi:hypothetical protein
VGKGPWLARFEGRGRADEVGGRCGRQSAKGNGGGGVESGGRWQDREDSLEAGGASLSGETCGPC